MQHFAGVIFRQRGRTCRREAVHRYRLHADLPRCISLLAHRLTGTTADEQLVHLRRLAAKQKQTVNAINYLGNDYRYAMA